MQGRHQPTTTGHSICSLSRTTAPVGKETVCDQKSGSLNPHTLETQRSTTVQHDTHTGTARPTIRAGITMTNGGTIDDGWRRKAMPGRRSRSNDVVPNGGLPLLTSANTGARQWNAERILPARFDDRPGKSVVRPATLLIRNRRMPIELLTTSD